MGWTTKRLFKISDDLLALDEEEQRVNAELAYHRLIDDDTQRDAVISGENQDRLEASSTAKDVARFERRLREISQKRDKLNSHRSRLLNRL